MFDKDNTPREFPLDIDHVIEKMRTDMLADLANAGLSLQDAAELSDKELNQRYGFKYYWINSLRTEQISAGISTPTVDRVRFYREARELNLPPWICNIIANAGLSVERAANMSDEELSAFKGFGYCSISRLRGAQVDHGMQSYHLTIYRLSRIAIENGITQRGVGVLLRENLTPEDTFKLSDAELSKIEGVGRATIGELRQLEMAWLPSFL